MLPHAISRLPKYPALFAICILTVPAAPVNELPMLIAFAYCFPISNKAPETVSKTVELNLDALIEPEKGEFTVPVFVIAAFTVRPAEVISPAKAEVPLPFEVTVVLDVSPTADIEPFAVIARNDHQPKKLVGLFINW